MRTALYIHVPLCLHKCAYCDFVSVEISSSLHAAISDALRTQLSHLAPQVFSAEHPIHSIYIGGGTPTALDDHLLDIIDDAMALPGAHDVEITVETNPETTDAALIRELVARGVNRFSLGVQSFRDEELRALGRIHGADTAREALRILTSLPGIRVSLDLMAGIPEQTMDSWRTSLAEAIASGVGHMSIYPLTVENGTPLAARVGEGLELPDDDTVADMLEEAARMLADAGFARYETSNYAKPGQESQHNLAYWSGVPYVGIGPSASSMNDTPHGRERYSWTHDVPKYLREPLSAPVDHESLTMAQRAAEDLMLGLRRSEGITLEDEERWSEQNPLLRASVAELIANDMLEIIDGHIRIPEDTWLLGNEIFGRIWTP